MRSTGNEFRYALIGLALLGATVVPFITSAGAAAMDGVVMRHRVVMIIKQGHPAMPMTGPMTMADGSIVTTDGIVKKTDGTRVHLREGDMVMMDGHIMHGSKARAMEKGD
ncbi:MAG TPA: DUF6799 domain-containing protein [Candidatus Binataceae bacterium]|nr:DUF6799 domain-containing protein [Candidatus Binataceae bacterium]